MPGGKITKAKTGHAKNMSKPKGEVDFSVGFPWFSMVKSKNQINIDKPWFSMFFYDFLWFIAAYCSFRSTKGTSPRLWRSSGS
jgi:hypothetical protein